MVCVPNLDVSRKAGGAQGAKLGTVKWEMRSGMFAAVLVVWGLSLACVAHAADAPPVAVDLTYLIGPGDKVHVEVVGEPAMSGDKPVEADGSVQLPHAGRVFIAGYTLGGATEQLTARLRDGYLRNPQVVVTVVQLGSKNVTISGGVGTQGEYPFTSASLYLSELLVRAGGLIDHSAPKAELWRDSPAGRQVIPVDLQRLGAGDRAADVALLPGDHLEVPPALQIFVDGHVQKPGQLVFREGMTVTQAIAAAGGTNGTALTTKVKVIRGEEQTMVNLRKVLKGTDADVALRPGDHVYVPESPI